MFSYIVRRLAVAVPTILILVTISFVLMWSAPGSPFMGEKLPPPEVMAALEAKYGLDQPYWKQYLDYLSNVIFHFDFGPSFKFKDRTVNDIIAQGFPVTLTYGFWSFIVAVVCGVGLGVTAAIRHNTWLDYLSVSFAIGSQSIPNYVMAPILVLVFTLWLGWLPGGGWEGGTWDHIIMPVIALSTSYFASIARITRSSMLEVLNSGFIRTAKAKGLPMSRVIFKHALKPALLPVLSYLGPAFVGMVTGSVIIDQYFSTGGIGQFFVNSAFNRDYSTMMGITILVGTLTIIFNLLVDVLYAWIDPKIRY
jgi:oligopeptide transport system permease protein